MDLFGKQLDYGALLHTPLNRHYRNFLQNPGVQFISLLCYSIDCGEGLFIMCCREAGRSFHQCCTLNPGEMNATDWSKFIIDNKNKSNFKWSRENVSKR